MAIAWPMAINDLEISLIVIFVAAIYSILQSTLTVIR